MVETGLAHTVWRIEMSLTKNGIRHIGNADVMFVDMDIFNRSEGHSSPFHNQ